MKRLNLFLGIMLSGLLFCSSGYAEFHIPNQRPSQERWCYDWSGVLSTEVEDEINDQARRFQKTFDVDFVVVIVPDLGVVDINAYATDLFSRWKIGESTQGKKGILILIARKEQKVRIEVGYDLEGIYTDAYVGMVERDILTEFLEQAEWGTGFLATIESFLFRLYDNERQDEVKAIASPDDTLEYYSQGAGASGVFDFGAALNRPLPQNYDEIRAYFSAQPTPQQAFLRYMDLCAHGIKHNNDLTLFTDLSNQFWKDWKHTSGQQRAEAQSLSGRSYDIKDNGEHAVVFFPSTDMRKTPMYFLAKSEPGWQVDISTMARVLRNVGPGWWMMTDVFHPYSEIIIKEYNIAQGFLAPWGDSAGAQHIYRLGGVPNDENIPGVCVGVWQAYQGGSNLKRADSIVAVNNQAIRDGHHLMSFFEGARSGASFKIDLIRDGRRMTVTETIPPAADGFRFFRPCLKTPRQWIGVYMVQSLDKEWRETLKMRDQGKFRYSSLCEIIDIYPGSPADRAGLKVRDLIVDYGADDDNGEIMPRDVIDHLYQLQPGESMDLTVVRDLSEILKITVSPEQTNHPGYF